MACVPSVNDPALKLAAVTPAVVFTLTGLPVLVPSIANWTVPVGVPAPGAATLIVAVKITPWPNAAGLAEDVRVVLVLAWLTIWLSVPGLLLKFASPE